MSKRKTISLFQPEIAEMEFLVPGDEIDVDNVQISERRFRFDAPDYLNLNIRIRLLDNDRETERIGRLISVTPHPVKGISYQFEFFEEEQDE